VTKTFLRFVQCNASGNHCLIDTLESTRYARCDDLIEYIISALVINRYSPNAKYFAPKNDHAQTAQDHLKCYFERLSIVSLPIQSPIDEVSVEKAFRFMLKGQKFVFFAHGTGLFSNSKLFKGATSDTFVEWTKANADESVEFLKSLCQKNGYEYSEACLVRHPSDIVLSRLERYFNNQKLSKISINDLDYHAAEVRNALLGIKEKLLSENIPIFKYEEIVRSAGRCLSAELCFSNAEMKQIRKDVYFSSASTGKRYKYSRKMNNKIRYALNCEIDWLGYEWTDSAHPFYFWLKAIYCNFLTIKSDIILVLRIHLFGYMKNGQFYHHKLSIPGRFLHGLLYRTTKALNKLSPLMPPLIK
jgi:hypothetical protein|tara:strand:- start:160 stop:1236 length:1077 start_codon:yes stop_codon:yes gene_type:complete